MRATITLPSGRKLRSQTQRRFILAYDAETFDPRIIRRSDNLLTLRREQGRYMWKTVLLDTVTKSVVS